MTQGVRRTVAMRRFTSKTYLKLLIVAGILAVIGGGAGTFASFNAEVTNQSNVFANGTLFLHAQPNGGTTCTSESDTTSNSGTCTFLFNTTLTGGTRTATLKLTNAGTIDASDIKFKVAGCTIGDNFAVTGVHTVFGTAPTCTNLQLAIQETDSSFSTPSTDVYCAYGTVSGNDCTIDTGHNLGTATSLTTLLTTGGTTATLTAGSSRYYVVEINPNVATDNSLQNRRAQFDVTWHIDQ
jgi:predicted ribosomally synthesized peptide with SipW-like signal peptide